ncbi:MAG: hypothetical protein H6620_06255 [Halobacteriovoraceae bacterium]|nr:hypothetical protein [Halobacteriovoraceae bacterium]
MNCKFIFLLITYFLTLSCGSKTQFLDESKPQTVTKNPSEGKKDSFDRELNRLFDLISYESDTDCVVVEVGNKLFVLEPECRAYFEENYCPNPFELAENQTHNLITLSCLREEIETFIAALPQEDYSHFEITTVDLIPNSLAVGEIFERSETFYSHNLKLDSPYRFFPVFENENYLLIGLGFSDGRFYSLEDLYKAEQSP